MITFAEHAVVAEVEEDLQILPSVPERPLSPWIAASPCPMPHRKRMGASVPQREPP